MFGWLAIAWCHWRFRRAYIKQGNNLNDLVYKAKFFPVGPIVGMIICVLVILTAEKWVFTADPFSFADFIYWYWPVPVIVGLYFVYKFVMKTKIIPLEECDFSVEYKVHKRGDQ